MRRTLAWLILILARVWVASLRLKIHGAKPGDRGVIAFFHGEQFLLLKARPRRPIVAPISLSRDGRLQAKVMKGFGVRSIDGSTSRRALGAARGLVRSIKDGSTALIAVDGPRGPHGSVQQGAVFLSQQGGGPLWAARARARCSVTLSKTWDQFVLPIPFSVVDVYFSRPVTISDGACRREGTEKLAEMLHGLLPRS